MEKIGNILFCGVGGQGILLASDITSAALLRAGFDVKKSEVHGMAQRGGAVVAHLRYGAKVYSPLIELGTAHMAVAFELLESLRYLPYLNSETTVIVNTQKILPPSVTTGVEAYPDDVLERLGQAVPSIIPVDALAVAESVGQIRAVNMVLVGSLSAFLPVPEDAFYELLKTKVPERFYSANAEAFRRGREIVTLDRGRPPQAPPSRRGKGRNDE